jgi:hypothetical protein
VGQEVCGLNQGLGLCLGQGGISLKHDSSSGSDLNNINTSEYSSNIN